MIALLYYHLPPRTKPEFLNRIDRVLSHTLDYSVLVQYTVESIVIVKDSEKVKLKEV